jgi:hypothetical protein
MNKSKEIKKYKKGSTDENESLRKGNKEDKKRYENIARERTKVRRIARN